MTPHTVVRTRVDSNPIQGGKLRSAHSGPHPDLLGLRSCQLTLDASIANGRILI